MVLGLFLFKCNAFATSTPLELKFPKFLSSAELESEMRRLAPKGCTSTTGSFVSKIPLAIPTPYRHKNSNLHIGCLLNLAAVQDGSRFPCSAWQRHESTSVSLMASKTLNPRVVVESCHSRAEFTIHLKYPCVLREPSHCLEHICLLIVMSEAAVAQGESKCLACGWSLI